MTQKEVAISFLKMAASGEVKNAYERFTSQQSPNKSIDIKHIYEDGDRVITHSHVVRKAPESPGIAVVHIFKFEKNRIIELWDLGQEILKNSPNENGPF